MDALPRGGKGVVHWDDTDGRFGLRVTAKGIRSYVIQYRNAQGRSRRLTIGRHGAWVPDQARDEAMRLLRLADHAQDLAEGIQNEREAVTVSQLCDEYVKAAYKGSMSAPAARPAGPICAVQTREPELQRSIFGRTNGRVWRLELGTLRGATV